MVVSQSDTSNFGHIRMERLCRKDLDLEKDKKETWTDKKRNRPGLKKKKRPGLREG